MKSVSPVWFDLIENWERIEDLYYQSPVDDEGEAIPTEADDLIKKIIKQTLAKLDGMKPGERQCYIYLRSLGLGEVVFEPDGNQTPDFLIDGKIAVEQTDLVEQFADADGKVRPLDGDCIAIWRTIKQIFSGMGLAQDGKSWVVSLVFSRPIPDMKAIKKQLPKLLVEKTQKNNTSEEISFNLSESFEVRVKRHVGSLKHLYHLGFTSDNDAGGLVMAKMENTLAWSIEKKTNTLEKSGRKYPINWLVICDRLIVGDCYDYEVEQIRKAIGRPTGFDRIIILKYNKPEILFEL